jgi:hypothetical protein
MEPIPDHQPHRQPAGCRHRNRRQRQQRRHLEPLLTVAVPASAVAGEDTAMITVVRVLTAQIGCM